MKAAYQKYTLDFKIPGGTSRGILHNKDTFFLIIKENGDHIGTIRTEVRTANCAFDDKFEYLYMTSDMFLTRIKIL